MGSSRPRIFNWRRMLFVYGLLQVVVLLMGCTATWLGAVNAILPALEQAITLAISFIAALEGKTVPAAVLAAVKKIGDDIGVQVANAKLLIADFGNTASTGLLSQIEAVFKGIMDNINAILAGFSVTDSATVSKFTQLIGLAVSAVQAILGFIPLVMARLKTASKKDLMAEDKVTTKAINAAVVTMNTTYEDIISESTNNSDVNAALANLPRTLAA
jgi:hypothetical protein